jgi:hypothetical protein
MSKLSFVEDIFLAFYSLMSSGVMLVQSSDQSAITSFYNVIRNNQQFTENQASFLLKILTKYKVQILAQGIDCSNQLKNPAWKNTFRVLDLSKKIFVEIDEESIAWICCKFPYQLKDSFENEIVKKDPLVQWDPDRKIKKILLHTVNLIALNEFALKNNFEIDKSFQDVVSEVEEIWNRQSEIEKYSIEIDGQVYLVNADTDAESYWNDNKQSVLEHDLFLASCMKYPLHTEKQSVTLLEKISKSKNNIFWIQNLSNFFEIYKSVSGNVCVLVDRTVDSLEYLQNFVKHSDLFGIPRSDIKVCFRDSSQSDSQLNGWIKENDLGGKVQEGKIFIFNHKPAKWLFKNNISVKIIVTNNLYPDTVVSVREWIRSHPCVFYVGNIKPSLQKEINIVDL